MLGARVEQKMKASFRAKVLNRFYGTNIASRPSLKLCCHHQDTSQDVHRDVTRNSKVRRPKGARKARGKKNC